MSEERLPDHLSVPPDRLGEGTRILVRLVGDAGEPAQDVALAMARAIRYWPAGRWS
jgi:hypothetical protein